MARLIRDHTNRTTTPTMLPADRRIAAKATGGTESAKYKSLPLKNTVSSCTHHTHNHTHKTQISPVLVCAIHPPAHIRT